MGIDRAELAAILRLRDPGGVVSTYIDADPADAAAPVPAWAESIRVELRRLDLDVRCRELTDDLDWALSSSAPRGRAVFFGAQAGPAHRVSVRMPLETSVTVAASAYVLPLLAALDRGRPAGIVAVTMAEARIIELVQGEAKEIARYPVAPPEAEWSLRKEPNPLHNEDRHRIVRNVRTRTKIVAEARGWDRLVLAGNAQLTHALAAALHLGPGVAVDVDPRDVARDESAAEIAALVRGRLDAADRSRAAADVEGAVASAAAGRHGAVGLEDVGKAVTVGRAAWVALDRDIPTGTPRADDAAAIIERALATDAGIAVLEPSVHPALVEAGAVANLRW